MSIGSRRIWFWVTMLGAQIGGFIIFKDLADISQWLVQSPREFTMAVWYNRHVLLAVSVLLLFSSLWFRWRERRVCPQPVLMLLLLFFLVNVYSGLLNPSLMFRPQQHEAMFVGVDEAPAYMQRSLDYARFGNESYASVDDINVLVLETDHGAYAYSDYYLLQPHVAEADTVNGEPVVMTYCGLANLGIAYSPVLDGQELELSVMTQLKNNLVLKDANSGEPIQQILGRMEGAPEKGKLKEYATIRMPFRSFRELYPDGKVFINEIPPIRDHPIIGIWDRLVRHGMMYPGVSLQWNNPDKPAFPTIKDYDKRLPMKQLIYALNVADDYVAYTRDFIISQGGLINVKISGQNVVIAYDDTYDAVTAFFNPTGAAVTAVDVFGRTADGRQLGRVNTLKSDLFWFIFAEFYPQTDVNRVSNAVVAHDA